MFASRTQTTHTKDVTMATTKKTATATPTVEELQNLSYIEVVTQASDAILKSITESQEQLLKATEQALENLPKAPEFAVPAAPEGSVPSPRELLEVSFAFADRLLASQKAFAVKYLSIATA